MVASGSSRHQGALSVPEILCGYCWFHSSEHRKWYGGDMKAAVAGRSTRGGLREILPSGLLIQ